MPHSAAAATCRQDEEGERRVVTAGYALLVSTVAGEALDRKKEKRNRMVKRKGRWSVMRAAHKSVLFPAELAVSPMAPGRSMIMAKLI